MCEDGEISGTHWPEPPTLCPRPCVTLPTSDVVSTLQMSLAATATGGLQHGCHTTVKGLSEGYCRMDPSCLDHHNPPPMEKQK